MLEWTTITTLARAGTTAYQNRDLLQKWWKQALAHIDKGSTNILVTGRPGVGKTTLVAQMHGYGRSADFKLPEESTKVEVEAITLGKWTQLVRTLPGQTTSERTIGLNEHLRQNDHLQGVIHVVDFGFTLPRDNDIIESFINAKKIRTTADLQKYNLANEEVEIIKTINEIETSITTQATPKWMIIAVNKLDLFADKRSQALDYYHPHGSSTFSAHLKASQDRVGSNALPIYIVPICAYEQPFSWNNEETPSKLQKQEERELLRDFMHIVATISERHSP